MIEKMLAIDLVCLAEDQEHALIELRELAIVHPTAVRARETADLAKLRKRLEKLTECLRVLSTRKPSESFDYSTATMDLEPHAMSERVHELIVDVARHREQHEHWRRAEQNLLPWGAFDPHLVKTLRDKGLHITFCACSGDRLPAVPADAILHVISTGNGRAYFVVIADRELDLELPAVAVPLDMSLGEVRERMAACEREIEEDERELDRMQIFLPKVQHDFQACQERIEYGETLAGMGEAGALTYLCGYAPAEREAQLVAAAREHGWALRFTTPDPEDAQVPTLITVPKWLRVSTPIFDFVGITPGYTEFDISGWFLVFFTIFFAMIIGDAGYGTLFLGAALVGKFLLKGKARREINLCLVLSVATIIWGALNGSWLGLEQTLLPPIPWLDPQALVADATGKLVPQGSEAVNHHIEFFCFLLAAIHLTIAHAWRMILVINRWLCLAQLGWALAVWANFLLAAKLVAAYLIPTNAIVGLYIAAGLLILLFTEPSRNLLKTVGLGLGSIAGGGVNSFVDVVSYIRLFAVGMSSYYVAHSFNGIAGPLLKNPWILAVGVLVFVFGHLLNIALSMLGVLVHGIRLNTLEFSGHLGLEWKGIRFRPFARRVRE